MPDTHKWDQGGGSGGSPGAPGPGGQPGDGPPSQLPLATAADVAKVQSSVDGLATSLSAVTTQQSTLQKVQSLGGIDLAVGGLLAVMVGFCMVMLWSNKKKLEGKLHSQSKALAQVNDRLDELKDELRALRLPPPTPTVSPEPDRRPRVDPRSRSGGHRTASNVKVADPNAVTRMHPRTGQGRTGPRPTPSRELEPESPPLLEEPAPTRSPTTGRRLDHLRYGDLVRALDDLSQEVNRAYGYLSGNSEATAAMRSLASHHERRRAVLVELDSAESQAIIDQWVEPCFIPLLDEAALVHSHQARQARAGDATAQTDVEAMGELLYNRISGMAAAHGWFIILEVTPFVTPFNAQLHSTLGTKPAPDAVGKVVEVQQVGLADPGRTKVLRAAQVYVGRAP